jgi:chitinase
VSSMLEGKRLSVPRLLVALAVTGSLVGAGFWGTQVVTAAAEPQAASWFAGYTDVTATPTFAFETSTAKADKNVVLSFVVSTPGDVCKPSWGTAYSLDEASATLDLDRRVARLQQEGGDVAISFGGQQNDELASACTNLGQLEAAYSSVVDRYSISTIDLDIEGDNLTDTAGNARRAEAIAEVQKAHRAAGSKLAVWLTLPVTPDGLTPDGQAVVRDTLAKGVDLAGVNAMTFDFGSSLKAGTSVLSGATQSLTSVQRQLGVLYKQAGTTLSDKTLWSKIGATPMIGQTDEKHEVFTLAAAKSYNTFAKAHGVGRVSMWSLNRDRTCGSNYTTLTVVSDSCSGVAQGTQSFAKILAAGFTGRPLDSAGTVTTSEPIAKTSLKDDPATSPYPIWSDAASYLQGTKIVWHHNVYQAKWWTRGDLPDNPVLNAYETPWTLVGPVLKGEKPIPVPTLPDGSYPYWQGSIAFQKGDRVIFDSVPYEAKWWTQGDSPAAASSDPDSSSWVPLTLQQVKDAIAAGVGSTPTPTPTPTATKK